MTRQRPLPRVEVELGPTVPGWALRAAAVVVTSGALILATLTGSVIEGFADTLLLAAAAIGLWVAWKPGHQPALLTAVLVALLLAFRDGHGALAAGTWLAPLAYLALRLCVWTACTGLTARVELAALARSAGTDGLVVGATILLGALAQSLERRSFAGLAVGAVALLGLVLLVRRTEDEQP